MYPTKEQFVDLLRTTSVDSIIQDHLFDGLPFYSQHSPGLHTQLLRGLSSGLRVPKEDICVVGSGRIGFSLTPNKFGDPFDNFSDLDVVVVSSVLFDPSWLDILKARPRTAMRLRGSTKAQLSAHRNKHHIYNGWIYPDSVVEALNIGETWLRTFRGLSRIPELAGRDVSGRLYRTWEHARIYHR